MKMLALAFLFSLCGTLLMYVSASKNTTHAYETRRSSVLLEAARNEAANRQSRERAKGPRDKTVIYLGAEWECLWWCDQLGVTAQTLERAVREVGPMAADIKRHLRSTATRQRARTQYSY